LPDRARAALDLRPALLALEAQIVFAARLLGEALELLVVDRRLDRDRLCVGELVGGRELAVGPERAAERQRLGGILHPADDLAVAVDLEIERGPLERAVTGADHERALALVTTFEGEGGGNRDGEQQRGCDDWLTHGGLQRSDDDRRHLP